MLYNATRRHRRLESPGQERTGRKLQRGGPRGAAGAQAEEMLPNHTHAALPFRAPRSREPPSRPGLWEGVVRHQSKCHQHRFCKPVMSVSPSHRASLSQGRAGENVTPLLRGKPLLALGGWGGGRQACLLQCPYLQCPGCGTLSPRRPLARLVVTICHLVPVVCHPLWHHRTGPMARELMERH